MHSEAKHSLHCATNLNHNQAYSRTRHIKLDAWNAWQKDDILLCCMMFTTHWLYKMCTVKAKHSLRCATNLKNHHTESRIRYIKLDAWNAWQKDDIWLCCMMFSTHWPHKMCTVKPNIVCTVLPTWTTIKLIQEQGTSCFVAWCFKVAGFTRCATVVANHSLHCATNLKNHHTWSRKRYIKLDAWNAW